MSSRLNRCGSWPPRRESRRSTRHLDRFLGEAPIDEFDVIVVGGGGSGLAAAYSSAELGGSVLQLEKRPQLGGTTGIAVGSFTAAGTSLQRHAGIVDSPHDHDVDVAKFAPPKCESRNNAELRQWFLGETAATYEWLVDLGLSFYGPSPEPPNRVPRMHNVVPGAKAYVAALQLAFLRHGGTILCSAEVRSLVFDGQRVAGVRTAIAGQERDFRARRGVVLAAGDYANSAELIGRHKGHEFAGIEGINPFATGEGHRLAAEAGARLINMDLTYGPELRFVPPTRRPFATWLPASGLFGRIVGLVARHLPAWVMKRYIKRLLVTWQHPERSLFLDGAILINRKGRRFTNERDTPQCEIDVARQLDKSAFILLDDRLMKRYSAWPHFISTAPDIAYAYVADYQRLRPDITFTATDLDRLARRASIDATALRQTVDEFNRHVAAGEADRFARSGDEHPLEGPTWVLLGPAKSYFTTTEGGAAVDRNLAVLDESGRPIRGLYAVGQNGLGGMVLWGHGLHIAWALTSGRLVGQILLAGEGGRPTGL